MVVDCDSDEDDVHSNERSQWEYWTSSTVEAVETLKPIVLHHLSNWPPRYSQQPLEAWHQEARHLEARRSDSWVDKPLGSYLVDKIMAAVEVDSLVTVAAEPVVASDRTYGRVVHIQSQGLSQVQL